MNTRLNKIAKKKEAIFSELLSELFFLVSEMFSSVL